MTRGTTLLAFHFWDFLSDMPFLDFENAIFFGTSTCSNEPVSHLANSARTLKALSSIFLGRMPCFYLDVSCISSTTRNPATALGMEVNLENGGTACTTSFIDEYTPLLAIPLLGCASLYLRMHAELPVLSFLCVTLLLALLPLHWKSLNISIISLIVWLVLCNTIQGVNSVLWRNDSAIRAVVWCDIGE